jgi:hypothetical protein
VTVRPAAAVLCVLLAGIVRGASGMPTPPLEPFTAQFGADWKGIGVATSGLELRRDAQPDHWVYTWRVSARGIFRMFYSDDLVQTSWFDLGSDGVRPRRYEATEGSKSVSLSFDWDAHRARGTDEGKPLELELSARTLDVLAIQIQVMQDLKSDSLPPRFSIIDKDEVKEFLYTREGGARLSTALGNLDTVIVASQREGNDRILRMWFAPSLGYIPVQAERTRGGKLEFAMRIRSLTRP